MSATQLRRCLKPEYQQRVDLVQEKPFRLVKWNFKKKENEDDDLEIDETDMARSKTVDGIKAYVRLNKSKLDPSFNYSIYRDFIDEFIEGWAPSFDEELIEEL